MRVQVSRTARDLSPSQLSVQTLLQCSCSPSEPLPASTPVFALKMPSIGSQSLVWTHAADSRSALKDTLWLSMWRGTEKVCLPPKTGVLPPWNGEDRRGNPWWNWLLAWESFTTVCLNFYSVVILFRGEENKPLLCAVRFKTWQQAFFLFFLTF